jgi:hypothetical protein
MVTSEMIYIFSSFIIKSSVYAVFCFVSLRDRIFILFLLMNIYFSKENSRSLSESNGHPLRDTCAAPERERSHFFVLGYRQAKTS